MTAREAVAAGVVVVLAVGLGWVSWSLASVQDELASLRAEVHAANPAGPSGSGKPPPIEKHTRRRAGDPEHGVAPEPLKPGELRIAVDEALERQTVERAEADAARWVEASRRKVEAAIEAMVDDGTVLDGEAGPVIELLMSERLDGAQLKSEVVAGDLSEAEAVDEWTAQRLEYAAALVALVGEERAADIRASLGGK